MTRKKETLIFIVFWVAFFGLERLGIISGNWHEDVRDFLLLFAAVGVGVTMYGVDDLKDELKRMKAGK